MLLQKNRIYMDHAAGAPIAPAVLKTVREKEKFFGNPSALHKEGVLAGMILEDSRRKIAALLGAAPDEIIFTGSGTESNNLAILGILNGHSHIITTDIEHPSVLETCEHLEKTNQAEITRVPVKSNGIVDPREIKKALRKNTVLVSVMCANNEIGTIQPIREIAKIIRHYRKTKAGNANYPLFHTDAIQAANYLDIRPDYLGADLLTLNGSKIYGPRGIGILYRRRGLSLEPILRGGGQEFGLRSGTENAAAAAGLAAALELAVEMREKESARLTELRDYFCSRLLKNSRIVLNGDLVARLPNNIHISIPGMESDLLILELDARGIAVSAGSACAAGGGEGSHVLRAIRPKRGQEADIRFSLGCSTGKRDIDCAVEFLQDILVKYGSNAV